MLRLLVDMIELLRIMRRLSSPDMQMARLSTTHCTQILNESQLESETPMI